jgi:hypothetical protein
MVAVCARLRPSGRDLRSPSQAAKFALRSTAHRIEALDQEVTALDRELEQLVADAAPRTTQLLGISTGHAGQLLVTAGQNIDRLRGDGSFSMLCGASPIPASSGKTTRHRLNPGGDRQANRTQSSKHPGAVALIDRADASASPPISSRVDETRERAEPEGRPPPGRDDAEAGYAKDLV